MAHCIVFIHNVSLTSNNNDSVQNAFVQSYYSGSLLVASRIFLPCSAAFITFINLPLIIGLKKTNKRLTISQKLYVYLSLTDIIMGFVGLMFFFITDITDKANCETFGIGMTINAYFFNVGFGTFVIISFLRNYVIRKPLEVIRSKTLKVMLILCQIYGILMGLLSFRIYSKICFKNFLLLFLELFLVYKRLHNLFQWCTQLLVS